MAGRWVRPVCIALFLLLTLLAGCGVEPTPDLEPTPTPGVRFLMPTPGTPHPSPSRSPTPESIRYIVQEGDTLYDIALRYGVEMDDIIEANDLDNPNALQIGQELIIPIQMEPTATPSP